MVDIRPLIAILLPLTAAILILVFGERIKANFREGITIVASIGLAATVYSMIPDILNGYNIEYNILPIAFNIELALKVDAAGMVFAIVSSTLWILTSIYSIGYMRGHNEINQTGYFSAFAMCISATIGICFGANLLTFFIFYEGLTIATYPLVVHYRDDEGKFSGRKYLTYTLISGQLFLAAIIIIYAVAGTGDFVPGGFITENTFSPAVSLIIFLMLVVGGAVKAGMMPFHSWLPAAMVAPTPVSALLHAVAVVKAGAFCVLRIVGYVFGPTTAAANHGAQVVSILAVFTIVTASVIALRKNNLKERLAFSTIGQLSYIILGICILSPYSMVGAIYHIVAHAFMKIILFMCAGAIFVTVHKKNISDLHGIGKRMPVTMSAFAVGSLGIAGLPLFVGFVSKSNILLGAIYQGKYVFVAVLIVSALLAITYLMPIVIMAFGARNEEFSEYGEASFKMLVPIVITSVFAIIFGVAPNAFFHLFDLAQMASQSIFS